MSPHNSAQAPDSDRLQRLRHSAAHVMAEAVLELFPQAKITAIGPPIEDGFYYDFELPRALTDEDLTAIEGRMKDILKKNSKFEGRELCPEEARRISPRSPINLN